MKKRNFKLNIFLASLLTASISCSVSAKPDESPTNENKAKVHQLTDKELNQLPPYMQKGYRDGLFTVKAVEEVKGLGVTAYAVHSPRSGDGLFFVRNGYMFVGNIIGPNGVSVTEQISKKYATPVDFTSKIKKLSDAKTISVGTGKKIAYVFVDPQCPHCVQRVLTGLKTNKQLLNDYTLKMVMVGFVAPNSKAMGEDIIKSSKEKGFVEAWQSAVNNRNKYKADDPSPSVEKNLQVMREVGVNSTPTIIVKDGDKWIMNNNLIK